MNPISELSTEDLEHRIKLPWFEFSHVGCMTRPYWWQFGRTRQFKTLVAELQGKMKMELWKRNGRWEGPEGRRAFFEHGCPDCGNDKFLEGPHGGMAVNFKCAQCGSKFNDEWVFGVERI
jgi:ribosomal protein S27E